MNSPYQICSRCVLDTTVADIRFDEKGECHYCHIHDALGKEFPLTFDGQKKFLAIINEIKQKGHNKKYDIIVGVSGGRDSTYALLKIVELGLRPLAVHLDNGWNSEIAVTNIKNATNKLGVDLLTHVLDWEEFKDLQLSFLKASVPDAEIPTDVAIHGILHKIAAQEHISYVVFAHSFRTEGVAPLSWTYMDGEYIKSVQKRFGRRKLKTFPNMTALDVFYYRFIKNIRVVPLLAYLKYDQKEVTERLSKELGWNYYGGHHHESYYTHFFQSYYLPKKFNIDKRKVEYSALIRSGQMTRQKALDEIQNHPYPYDEELVRYAIKKLGLTKKEFDDIMAVSNKSFRDYSTYYPFIKALKPLLAVVQKLNFFPKHLYLKFLG
ncbi:MAG TPA: N-acetyl sugar amidotransferase [Candidatus Omnitrophota bacterium]|nr:N-acetyl sugar amidotransferase [Candidatus Omnitrophota bacterium]HPN87758.1 N-acetyl sugar amidotransferase [Candidatus Omnitrophota bacterium]